MLQQVNKLPDILPGSRTPAQVQAHLYFQLAHEPQFQLLYMLECKKPLALKQPYFIFLRDKFKN